MTRRPLATNSPVLEELHRQDAYTMPIAGRWHIFIWTPSGAIVRLLTDYPRQAAALEAMGILGYRAVDPPKGD